MNTDFQDPISDLQVFLELNSKYILRIESNSINSTIRNRLLPRFIHFRKVLLETEAFCSLTRLPEITFYMKESYRILQFYILQGCPYRKEILHSEGKEIFEYFQLSCSIHPCMLQDLPKAFQTFKTFSHSRQLYMLPELPGIPPYYSIL